MGQGANPEYSHNRLELVMDSLFRRSPGSASLNAYEHLFEMLKRREAEILISAIAVDSRRSADFPFSKPYYETGDVIARHRNRFDISDLASLSRRRSVLWRAAQETSSCAAKKQLTAWLSPDILRSMMPGRPQ